MEAGGWKGCGDIDGEGEVVWIERGRWGIALKCERGGGLDLQRYPGEGVCSFHGKVVYFAAVKCEEYTRKMVTYSIRSRGCKWKYKKISLTPKRVHIQYISCTPPTPQLEPPTSYPPDPAPSLNLLSPFSIVRPLCMVD